VMMVLMMADTRVLQ